MSVNPYLDYITYVFCIHKTRKSEACSKKKIHTRNLGISQSLWFGWNMWDLQKPKQRAVETESFQLCLCMGSSLSPQHDQPSYNLLWCRLNSTGPTLHILLVFMTFFWVPTFLCNINAFSLRLNTISPKFWFCVFSGLVRRTPNYLMIVIDYQICDRPKAQHVSFPLFQQWGNFNNFTAIFQMPANVKHKKI